MLTQKVAIERVEHFAKELKDAGLHLRRVVLFGSYAHGKPHEWSDIDVALVADEFKSVGPIDVQLFSRINIKKPYIEIETRTYNTKDFTPEKDPFVEEILRTGIEIRA